MKPPRASGSRALPTRGYRLPVQVHTGFGDPDLDLRLANPPHLRRVFEDERFRPVPVMLLHASYPFAREAGYLAAVYPNAYLDSGEPAAVVSETLREVAGLYPGTADEPTRLNVVLTDGNRFVASRWGTPPT